MSQHQPSPRRAFDRAFTLALIASDIVACSISVLVAYTIRWMLSSTSLGELGQDITLYVWAIPVVAFLWLMTFRSLGLHDVRRFVLPLGEMTAVFRAVTGTTLMVATASFLSHISYSRAVLLLFWGTALVVVMLMRSALRSYMLRERTRGNATARTLIVGCGDLAQMVAQRIESQPLLGYELVGMVAVDDERPSPGGPVLLGSIGQLEVLVKQHAIEEVLVAYPEIDPGLLITAIQACRGRPVVFHLVARPIQILTQSAEISGIADLAVIELPPQSFPRWQSAVKRLLDVAASLLVLVLGAPLLALLAYLVWRDTGAGPIFRQRRVGLRGREFTMYKFRTMSPRANPYAEAPTSLDDSRVTRLGRWLRRSSLDEVPQFVNVLRGEMSIVGPRPEMPFIVAQYEPWQRSRLEVKPGITGLWQVLGRKDLPLRENIEYDFYYIRNWSIWLDITIILKTLPVVLGGRGAY